LSANTKRTYHAGMNCFRSFTTRYGLVEPHGGIGFPDETCLIYFVTHCFHNLGIRYETIKVYLCGVRHAYIQTHTRDPLSQQDGQPFLKLPLFLQSVKRLQKPKPNKRQPITANIMRTLIRKLTGCVVFDPFADLLFASENYVSVFFGFYVVVNFVQMITTLKMTCLWTILFGVT